MGLENLNIRPTLSEPTDGAKKVDTNFKTALIKKGVNPHVIKEDEKLQGGDKSLKSQIWDLDKMEALVYGDPKLSALYDKLAINGKVTYGYHWNETLMNIIFNQYVLHSPKYLERYKKTQGKDKERRDSSGNNALKNSIRKEKGLEVDEKPKSEKSDEGFDIQRDGVNRTEKKYDTMEEPIDNTVEETTGAASSGAFTPQLESENKIDETTTSASSGQYAGPSAWSKTGKPQVGAKKPIWKGGQILENAIKNGDYLTDPSAFKAYYASLNENIEPMMNTSEGMTSPNDDSRVPISEIGIFNNLSGSKNNVGQILSNNKDLFKKLKTLPAGSDDQSLVQNFTQIMNSVKNMGGIKGLVQNAEDERYAQFLVNILANYSVLVDRGLDRSPQVANLLRDVKAIIDPSLLKSLGEGQEVNMSEHHLNGKAEKIQYILKNKDVAFNGQVSPTIQQDLAAMSDADIDAIYGGIEKALGTTQDAVGQEEVTENMNVNETNVPATIEKLTKLEQVIGIDDLLDNILRKLSDDTANSILDEISRQFQLEMAETVIPATYEKLDRIKEAIGGDELLLNIVKQLDDQEANMIFDSLMRDFGVNDMEESADNTKQWSGGWQGGSQQQNVKESMIDQQEPSMVNGNPSSMVKPDMGGDAVASSSTSSTSDLTSLGESKDSKNELKNFGKPKFEAKGKQGDNTFNKGVNEPNIKPELKNTGNKLKNFGDAKIDKSEKSKDDKVNVPINNIKESIEKELAFFANHLNQLNDMVNEDRRPSALVNLDRLKKDNEANFKSDIKNNNIEDEVNMQDELMTDDLSTEVGENPYKLGQEIEKKALAKTNGGKSFENVGDSTNDKGDEIPKRNLTKEEMVAVAMNRGKGLQDIVYDNEPSKRFEERMKADMGDDIYKLRKDKMKYNANAPMYNKDTQPNEKGDKSLQFDKYKAGYNSTVGESVSAKYFDEFGKKKFIDFKINETVEIEKADDTFVKLSTEGMGNSYTTKVNENTSYSDFASQYDFYLKESVVYVSKKKQSLNESKETKGKGLNMDKINHLIGYKPSTFVDSRKSKKII